VVGLSGLAYLKYYEYSKINGDIEHLMARNELTSHLFETNQQSAFSIDHTMDSFERSYNQFSITKYRETLASLAAGNVMTPPPRSSRLAQAPTATSSSTAPEQTSP
jgi:hypothetical protein